MMNFREMYNKIVLLLHKNWRCDNILLKTTIRSKKEMSKTVGKSSPQTGKWEAKELGASQGRKNHSAVNPAPEKGMEQADQAERRSCLAER